MIVEGKCLKEIQLDNEKNGYTVDPIYRRAVWPINSIEHVDCTHTQNMTWEDVKQLHGDRS